MKFLKTALLLCLYSAIAHSQLITISGKVVEAESGESIVGAVVYWSNGKQSVVSDQYGHFVILGELGQKELKCNYPTYKPYSVTFTVLRDTSIIINLSPTTLQEVVIKDTPPNRQAGFLSIPINQLKRLPMLLGETDLLKALTFTPGIMAGQEGTSGLYVRGSSPDQNLVLLDESPVYNTSHAFGFLSVFNPDAVKNIDLYKGSFPARFGGRIASVIDITMKEGNNQKKKGELSLGIFNSRFLKEGPIVKGKSSYMIAGRLMHTALLQLPQNIKLLTGKPIQDFVGFWLYDFNAKINHTFKDKSELFYSFYSNYDFFKNASQRSDRTEANTLKWGSITSSLRYNKPLTDRLLWRLVGTYSHFNYTLQNKETKKVEDEKITNQTTLDNSIRDWSLKTHLDYSLNTNFLVRVGAVTTFHRFFPGRIDAIRNNNPIVIDLNNNQPIATIESALYAENEWTIGSSLKLNTGLRYSMLNVDNQNYTNWEPRAALTVQVSDKQNLKLGYSVMQQYMHQLTSNGVGLPNDIWVPATAKIKPIRSEQVEVGWYFDIDPKKNWSLSIESYYKKMQNLAEYQYGSDIIVDYQKNWQDIVITGVDGRAFGLETMIQKKQGKYYGWLSYTLAKSERQTPEINNGQWFGSRYDRRHNIAIVANYQISKKWSVVSNWVFQTGYPITLPSAAHIDFSGTTAPYYIGRNQGRMPNYHRLDIGAIFKSVNQKGRVYSWNIGVYNAYNRNNPYYLEVVRNYKNGIVQSLDINKRAFFPFLPYFSYQISY
jgi:outer membrane receptor for ferrienterochelin and colicin